MVAAPDAGLVEMEVLMCLGAVLICLACVSTRLPWVLGKAAPSVEKQFVPSAVYGKSNRAADSLCKRLLALVHSAVKECKFCFKSELHSNLVPLFIDRSVLLYCGTIMRKQLC